MTFSSLASCPCPPTPHSLLQMRGIHGDREMQKGKKEQAVTKAAAGKSP